MPELTVASFNLHWGVDMRGRPYDVARRVPGPRRRRAGAPGVVAAARSDRRSSTSSPTRTGADRPRAWRSCPTGTRARPRHLDAAAGTGRAPAGSRCSPRCPVRVVHDVDAAARPPGDVVERRHAIVRRGRGRRARPSRSAGIHASHRLWGSLPSCGSSTASSPARAARRAIAGDCNMWGPPIALVLPRPATARCGAAPGRRGDPHSQIDHIWIDDRPRGRRRRASGPTRFRPPGRPRPPAACGRHAGPTMRRRHGPRRSDGWRTRYAEWWPAAKGAPVTIETIVVPDPGPGRGARARCRPAACATPTCTTARAPSTTSSRSCSATRPRASSRRSAPDVTEVAPGDFVILNWRAVCGECRSCRRGRPLVLLRHPQRHAEDDARRRHRALARARHRRVRREDARGRRPGHQGRPRAPTRRRPACSAAA